MNSGFVGLTRRDPKTFTGLSKRNGAVSHIAKSFENVEKNCNRDSQRGRLREDPQRIESYEGLARDHHLQGQYRGLQRLDHNRDSQRQLRQQKPRQHSPSQQNLLHQQQQKQQRLQALQKSQYQQKQQKQQAYQEQQMLQQQQLAQQQKQQQLQQKRQQEGLFRSRESYGEPVDALHLPRPTISHRLQDDQQNYDDPKDDPDDLRDISSSQGKLYFGSSFITHNEALEKPSNQPTGVLNNLKNLTPKILRGPTLGEMLRGDIVTSSNRSFGVPNPRDPEASARYKKREYPVQRFDDFSAKDSVRGKSLSDQNLSQSQISTANINQIISNGLNNEAEQMLGRSAGLSVKPPTPIPQRSTRIINSRRPPSLKKININKERNVGRTAELQNRTENNSFLIVPESVNENGICVEHTYDLDIIENGVSCSVEGSIENGSSTLTGKT